MRLTKDESEINLANGEAEPEFAEWKWAGPEEVVEQVCYRYFLLNSQFQYDIYFLKSFVTYGIKLITGGGLQKANI